MSTDDTDFTDHAEGRDTNAYYVIDHPAASRGNVLADIQGYDPVTGTARYYTQDHLGSTRTLRSQAKATLARFDYDPYGGPTYHDGASATRTYTGHDLDPVTGMYFAPYRYYAPGLARWTARDPLGERQGPNMYSYVRGLSTTSVDLVGLDRCKVIDLYGHEWIRVQSPYYFDEYGNKVPLPAGSGGWVDLHAWPNFAGHPDYTQEPAAPDNWHVFSVPYSNTLSTPEQDEALIKRWFELSSERRFDLFSNNCIHNTNEFFYYPNVREMTWVEWLIQNALGDTLNIPLIMP
ncbi:MAG: RHS repeat-associated core domain-containing protein [Candidatus Hydrogenedentes bacterium]|nr:RHS repeat-associated core domain-containing protein [Candidatus Hydrogenedentota bacterium]